MDINKASREELQRAFEVDGERAQYIVERRNQLGGFESWDQIKEVVPSIEDKMVENLRAAGLTIGPRGSRAEDRNRQRGGESDSQPSSEHRTSASQSTERDVNTVSREELEEVCQIDGERADYFLQTRRELGGFSSWEEIKEKVPSFEDGMIERLRNAGFRVGRTGSKAA
jgi:DNA uptake protein ComE-like DNA-binding protein